MSNLTPMDFCPDAEWHDFTPTMESGYALDNAKYKKITDQFVYITMLVHRSTAGAIDAYVCTLPSFMRPPVFSPISALGATSQSSFLTASAAVGGSGKVKVYEPQTNAYYVYLSGVVPTV